MRWFVSKFQTYLVTSKRNILVFFILYSSCVKLIKYQAKVVLTRAVLNCGKFMLLSTAHLQVNQILKKIRLFRSFYYSKVIKFYVKHSVWAEVLQFRIGLLQQISSNRQAKIKPIYLFDSLRFWNPSIPLSSCVRMVNSQ